MQTKVHLDETSNFPSEPELIGFDPSEIEKIEFWPKPWPKTQKVNVFRWRNCMLDRNPAPI